MHRYGIVEFFEGGENSAKLKKQLIKELNSAGVITVTEREIETWFEEDKNDINPVTYKFALHNREEAQNFKTIAESLKVEDSSIKWKVSRIEQDKKIRKWFNNAEAERRKEQHGKRKKV